MFSEQVWVRVLQHVNNRNVWCEHMGPMAALFVHCIFWKLFKTPVLYSSSEGNVFFFFLILERPFFLEVSSLLARKSYRVCRRFWSRFGGTCVLVSVFECWWWLDEAIVNPL